MGQVEEKPEKKVEAKTDKTDTYKKKGDKRDEEREAKKTEFIEKLKNITYAGNVWMVCQAMGISRSQAYVWRDDDPNFADEWAAAVKEGLENQIEETEQALRKGVLDSNITAIIFKLKSLKPDVYGDKIEHSGSVTEEHVLKPGSVSALKRLLQRIENEKKPNK